MAGIHTILSSTGTNGLVSELDLNEALLENWFKLDVIIQTPQCLSAVSYHEGYPFSVWQEQDITIALDGIVYNFSLAEVQTRLVEIARRFADSSDYQGLVRRFVETADGDFLVQIRQNTDGKLLIFNDYLARLAFFYYCDDTVCVFSREPKIILHFIPRINLNRAGLIDFVLFEYTLGNKTIFQDVFRLQPAQMLEVKPQDRGFRLQVTNSSDFNFVSYDTFSNQAASIDFLRDVFLQAVKNRSKTLERNGYRLIADLSGGFDTRTVLAGLSRVSRDVTYFSPKLSTGDESDWAQEVFQKMGSPGEFRTVQAKHSYDTTDLVPLVRKTDGAVNYYSTYVCYQDVQAIKKQFPGKVARFTGLGGEFIRHPAKHYYHSLFRGLSRGLYSMPVETACRMMKLNPDTYLDEVEAYLNTYPEKTRQDQLKRWYYEYYNHYVGAAAEDRERIHFWTVAPLWGLDFIRTIFNRVPLPWASYRYFIRFMKAIDPRLLQPPIYGKNIRLSSEFSVARFETQNQLRMLKLGLKVRIPSVRYGYWYWRSRQSEYKTRISALLSDFQQHYRLYHLAADILDPSIVEKDLMLRGDTHVARRISTLLMYLDDLERRYSAKF